MRKFLYGVFFTFLLTSLIVNGVLGYLYTQQNQRIAELGKEVEQSKQQLKALEGDYALVYPDGSGGSSYTYQTKAGCTEVYSDTSYPKFKFTYDKCDYEISEKSQKIQESTGKLITLKSKTSADAMTIGLAPSNVDSTIPMCNKQPYLKIAENKYRITTGARQYEYHDATISDTAAVKTMCSNPNTSQEINATNYYFTGADLITATTVKDTSGKELFGAVVTLQAKAESDQSLAYFDSVFNSMEL